VVLKLEGPRKLALSNSKGWGEREIRTSSITKAGGEQGGAISFLVTGGRRERRRTAQGSTGKGGSTRHTLQMAEKKAWGIVVIRRLGGTREKKVSDAFNNWRPVSTYDRGKRESLGRQSRVSEKVESGILLADSNGKNKG